MASPSMNLDRPRKETTMGISLMYLDPSTGDANDEDSYDLLLKVLIRSRRRVLECSSREAGGGFSKLIELKPDPWFQKDNPKLRIDVGANEFVFYVDGKRVGAVNRAVKRGKVTHFKYLIYPPNAESAMGKGVTVTTYKQISLVP
ncbi:hypothetical protein G7Y89_g11918 [Cudoniella acicularis]|uniref:Uncharacterized protein n=1 Tax=Cudoniella acicularis TaxID=354080 RepID=A0A8H4VXJ6_9HELO|nr:hypothetical protein G7Y89_g11918 [Cudoniella acicularis]